jgi:hypothetical protein
MNEELEPEVLSYREFRNRETLRAWELRRRAIESQPERWRDPLSRDRDSAKRRTESRGGPSPLS